MAMIPDLSNSLILESLDDSNSDENLLDDDENFQFLLTKDIDFNNNQSPVQPLNIKSKSDKKFFEPIKRFERNASLQADRDQKLSDANALKNTSIINNNLNDANNVIVNNGSTHAIHNFQSAKTNNEHNFQK
jgi:hypothetical protein